MRGRNRLACGVLIFAVVVITLMICTPPLGTLGVGGERSKELVAGASSVVLGKTLEIATNSEIETMDPSKTASMRGPAGMVLETLITRDKTGAYQPGLAVSWAWNLSDAAHPRFVLQLRQGVMFQDGTPFNAQAVKDNIMWYKQSSPSGEYGWVSYEFAAIDCANGTTEWGDMDKGVWVTDEYSLVLNCTFYDVALEFNLSHLYGSIMSPTAAFGSGATLTEAHRSYGTPQHPAVGTGPFMITEWVQGDHVTLSRFDNYSWGFDWYANSGPAHIDRIIYRMMPDDGLRYSAFESGDVDVLTQVAPSKLTAYASTPGISLVTGPGQGVYYVEFNCQKPEWSDPNLRRGIGFAINRSEIVSTAWHGYAEPGVNYIPPVVPEGPLTPAPYNYTYNLSEAGFLLATAGWWDRDSDGWMENATYSELTLPLATTNKGQDVAMSELLQQQLQAMGVHVSLTQYEQDTLLSLAIAGELNTMLFWYDWPRAEILDWKFGSWAANGGSNTAQYIDPVFDMYVVNWTYAPSPAAYSENVTRAHERLLTMGPWAPVVYWHQLTAIHDYVTGWYLNPMGQEMVFDAVDLDVDHPPTAGIAISPNPVQSGETVVLDASGSSDDVGIVNWTWTFTDASTPVVLWGETVSYTPESGPHSFDVTLTVRDTNGATNDSVATLVVGTVIPEFSLLPLLTTTMAVLIALSHSIRSKRIGSQKGKRV